MAQTEDIKLRLTSGKGNLNWVDKQEFEDNIADYIAKNPGAKIRMVDVDKQQYDIPLDRYQDARKSGARPYMFRHTTVVKQPEKPDWRIGNKVGEKTQPATQSQKTANQKPNTAMNPDNKALDYTRPSEKTYTNSSYAERAKEDPESNITPHQKATKNWADKATQDVTTQLTRPHIPVDEEGYVEGENIPAYLLRTEKEVSDDVTKVADNFASALNRNGELADDLFAEIDRERAAITNKYHKEDASFLDKLQGKGPKNGLNMGRLNMSEQEARELRNNAKPETILNKIQPKVKKVVEDYIKNNDVSKLIHETSKRYGISTEDVTNSISSQLYNRLYDSTYKKLVALNMPKDDIEYVLSGINNTILGTVYRMYSGKSALQKQIEAEAEEASIAEHSKDGIDIFGYKLNALNFGREAVSFVDPFFGLTGKASMYVVKKIAMREINNLVRKGFTKEVAQRMIAEKLENSMGKRVLNGMVQRGVGGGVNLGTYNLVSEATQQAYSGEFDPEKLLERTASGAGTGIFLSLGGLLGGTTARVGLKGGGSALAKRATAQLGGFLTEAMLFTGATEAEKYLTGNANKIEFVPDLMQSIDQLIAMKVAGKATGGMHGEVAGKGQVKKSPLQKTKEAVKAMFEPIETETGINRRTGGVHYTKDEQEHLKTVPSYRNMIAKLNALREKGTTFKKPDGTKEKVTDEMVTRQMAEFKAAYKEFINDKNVTFAEKQKFHFVFNDGQSVCANLPIACSSDVIDNGDGTMIGVTYDDHHNVIQRYKFKGEGNTLEERQANAQAKSDMFVIQQKRLVESNRILEMEGDYPEQAAMARQNLLKMGYTQEQIDAAIPQQKNSTSEQMEQKQTTLQKGMDAALADEIKARYAAQIAYLADIEDTYTPDFHTQQGYTLQGGDRHNAIMELNKLQEGLSDGTPDGEEFRRQVEAGAENPADALYQLANAGYTPEQIARATRYYNQKAKVDAMLEHASRSVDAQVEEANSNVRNNTHKESGNVLTVSDLQNNKYYVLSGRYGYDSETGRALRSECDQTLVVRNAQTGELEIKNPQDLYLISANSPDDLIYNNETTLRNSITERLDSEMSYAEGTPTEPVLGDTFVGRDGKTYMIEAVNGMPAKIELDGEGKPTKNVLPVDMEEYMDSKSAELDAQAEVERQAQAEAERQAQADLAGEQQGTEAETSENNAGNGASENLQAEQPAQPVAEGLAKTPEQLARVSVNGNVTQIHMTGGLDGYWMKGNLDNPEGQFKFGYFDKEGNLQTEDFNVSEIESKKTFNINEQPVTGANGGNSENPNNQEQPQLTAEEAVRQQELAEGEALAKRQEKLFKAQLVGYDTGNPDLLHPNTTPAAAAEWLIKQNGEDEAIKQAKSQLDTATEEVGKQKTNIDTETQYLNDWGDTMTPDELQRHNDITTQSQQALAEAQRVQKRWQQIHEAMMTPEARAKLKEQRHANMEKKKGEGYKESEAAYTNSKPADDAEGLAKDEGGKIIFSKSTPEAIDTHIDSNYAGNEEDYLKDKKLDLRNESDTIEIEKNRLAGILNEYENGEGLLTDEAAEGIAKEIGKLRQRQAQIMDEKTAINEAEKRLGNRKAELEAERRRKEEEEKYNQLTPEQKARLEEFENEKKKIEEAKDRRKQILNAIVDPIKKLMKAREIYAGTPGESHLDEGQMDPQTPLEYVSHLGAHVLAWDSYMKGDHKIRGAVEDLGLKRGIGHGFDTNGINYYLAPKGQGKGIEELTHELYMERPNETWSDQDIRNALIELLGSVKNAKAAKNMILDNRIERAEEELSDMEDGLLGQEYSDVLRYSKKNTPKNSQAEQPKTSAEELEVAKEETDTNPTEAQKEAGNYKKGHIKAGDLDVTVENPAGSVRKGTDKDGNEWSTTMHYTYGYIRGHEGADGDHVDIVVNDAADLWHWNGKVYVVDQKNDDGTFDEHKVMYGFDSLEEATQAYLSNYEPGWESHIQAVTEVNREYFHEWLNSSDKKTEPFSKTQYGILGRYMTLVGDFENYRKQLENKDLSFNERADIRYEMNSIRREIISMGAIPPAYKEENGLTMNSVGMVIKADHPELAQMIDGMGKAIGMKINIITKEEFASMQNAGKPKEEWVTPEQASNGVNYLNGQIYINLDSEDITPNKIAKGSVDKIYKAVFGHEANHSFFNKDKSLKKGWADLVERYYNRVHKGEYANQYESIKKLYKQQLEDITKGLEGEEKEQAIKDYINEELAGNIVGEMMLDKDFVGELLKGDSYTKDMTRLEKTRKMYRDLKKKFRAFMNKEQSRDINEIQKLIRKAYMNSVKAQVEKTNTEAEKNNTSDQAGAEKTKLSKKKYFEIGKRFFDDVLHAPVTDFYDVHEDNIEPMDNRGWTLANIADSKPLAQLRREIFSTAKQWKGQIGNAAAGAFLYNEEANSKAMPSLAKWISNDIIDNLEEYKGGLETFKTVNANRPWMDTTVVDEQIADVDKAIKWYEEFGRGEHITLGQHEIDNIMYSKKDILRRDRAEHAERPEGTLATAGTLFSGGGLLEQGLKEVVEPKFAAEWNKKIRGVYRDNNGDHMIFADATNITLPDIMQAVRGGHVDYLHTSPVCKNFSGAKLNRGETEGDMEFGKACARAIAMTEPDVYTLENVPAYQSSEALKRVTDMLDRLGYTWDVNVIDAADYGAATSRKRMILRAVKEGLTLPPLPAYKERGDWYERVKDLFEMIDDKDIVKYPSYMTRKDYKSEIPERLNDLIEQAKNIKGDTLLVLGKQYGKYRIVAAGQPAPTIIASNSGDEYIIEKDGSENPDEWVIGKVTPRMLARIQGLSDDYKLPESATLAHTIIGNGIPTELTKEVIAPMIVSRVNERKDKKQADARIEAKYDRLAQDYIPEFSRGTKKEDELRKVFDEYVTAQADDNVVPFLAPHMQYAGSVRTTAHKLKGEKYDRVNGKRQLVPITPEAQQEAINGAASDMARLVPKNAVLVPMPSHTGKATNTVPLAEAISKLTGAPVLDALEGLSRRSAHEAKMHGGKELKAEQMGMHWKEGVELPEGKRIVYIDNVIDNGNTAAAAVRVGKGGIVLAYAYAGDLKSKAVPLKSAELVTYDDHGQVIPLNERFNPTSDDIRFSKKVEDSDPFYSNAAKAVEGIKQGKATPEQWLKMIEKAGGLKKEEDKWMGLSDWLKGQDKKTLTREEVENFIAENAVKVEEVRYAEGAGYENNPKYQELNAEFQELIPEGEEATGSIYTDDHRQWAFNQMIERYGDDFSSAFDYDRDELVPTTDWDDGLSDAAQYFLEPDEHPIDSTRSQYTTKGLDNNKEIAMIVPSVYPYYGSMPEVHFADNYTDGKTVAWVRFGDAMTADKEKSAEFRNYEDYRQELDEKYGDDGSYGSKMTDEERNKLNALKTKYEAMPDGRQKVLVIDEIQSQRHQDGRESGYTNDDVDTTGWKVNRNGGMGDGISWYTVYDAEENPIVALGAKNEAEALEKAKVSYNEQEGKVPDAPFRSNWHELGMKRMLRYAAENGYDKIAWTSGAQQAKRYGLSSKVDKLSYFVNKDGRLEVRAWLPSGSYQPLDGATMENLDSYVGKKIADQIRNGEGEIDKQEWGWDKDGNRVYEDYKSIKGEDLSVGGEGMKGFYDNMLVKFMNKYGKKWGVKVGTVELPELEESGQHMWSVDVTPEMKESVMEGQPMFSKKSVKPSGEAEGEEPAVRYSLIGKKGAQTLDEFEKDRDKQLKRIAKMETALGIHGKWHMQKDRQRWEKIFEDDKEQRLKNLKVAQRMDASKRNKPTAETIKRATGWEKGADGQWRYEIGDATLSDKLLQNIGKVKENGPMMQGRFKDLVNAPELLEAYPELGDYYVNIYNEPNDSFYGFQRGRSIYLNIGKAKEDATPTARQLGTVASTVAEQIEGAKQWSWTNTLNHEIQHAIQDIEGFAQGGNTDSVHDILQKIRDEHKYLNDADMTAINLWTSDSNRAFEMHRSEYLMTRPARFLKSGEHFKYSGSKAEIIEQGQKLAAKDYYNGLMMLETVANRMGIDLQEYGLDLEKMSNDLDAMEERGMTPMDVARTGYMMEEMQKFYDDVAKIQDKRIKENQNLEKAHAYETIDKALKNIYDDYELYKRLAGEVEARAVGSRVGLTQDERRESPSVDDEDVKRTEQLPIRGYNILAGGIRFSKKKEDRSLVGMHNLSEDNLRHVLKMGGIANPSTAVVDMNVAGMTNFGDITLLMPSSLVAKKTGRNAGTWAADAYSPRYPYNDVVYGITDKTYDTLNDLYERTGVDAKVSTLAASIEDRGIQSLKNSRDIQWAYCKEHGFDPSVNYTPVRDEATLDEWASLNEGAKRYESTQEKEGFIRNLIEKEKFEPIRQKASEGWSDEEIQDEIEHLNKVFFRDGKINFYIKRNIVSQLNHDIDNRGKVDQDRTKANAASYVNDHFSDYNKWTNDLYDKLGIEEKIFDGFTPAGYRKYKAHTLENVSRMMKQAGKAGSENLFGTSPGALRAKVTPIFNTLQQIRKNKNRLVTPEEFNPIKEQINEECFDLESLLEGDMSGDEGFYRLEEAMKHGAEWVNRKYDDLDLDEEDIERINAFRQLLYEAPTEYFETKFERPVRLDEFQAAVVPTTTDTELKDALKENGLTIYEYDKNVAGDRERVQKLASMEDGIRFSKKRPTDINVNGRQYNVKELEDELKDELEYRLKEVYDYDDADIVGVKLIGSYMRGEEHEGSDLDLLMEYTGKAREDDLFNSINEDDDPITVNGVKVDVNPITEAKSGTIEEWEKRNEGFTKLSDDEEELQKTNEAFNKRIDELIADPDQKKRRIDMGYSGKFLTDGGMDKAAIELDYDRIVRKGSVKYKHDHPFDPSDIKGLPIAVNKPIAMFRDTNGMDNGFVILTELKKDDLNFIAVLQAVERNRKGGVKVVVNNISTLYPKAERGIVKWFIDELATNIDKEKALQWIEALRSHRGTKTSIEELNSATKVINNFKLSKKNREKVAEETENSDILSIADSKTKYSLRKKPAPKKTGIGYKVFYRGKDGKLYPPMVANPNGADTPIGVWLDADAAPVVGESKTGRPKVKQGGKGTQGGSGTLAYRPGWHLGEIPYALQFNRKDANGNRTLFPKDFVWAEVEYAADKDYQKEAEKEGYTENGKFRHSYAGLKRLPEDGYYRYRTNPNPETDPWIITGAMKVNKILTREEVDDLVRKAGREPQKVEGDGMKFSKRSNPEEEKKIWDEAKKDFPWMPEYQPSEEAEGTVAIEDMTADERRKFGEDLYLGTNRRMKAMIRQNAKGMSPYDQNRMAEATINTLYNIADTGAKNEAEQELLDKAKSLLGQDAVRYSKKQEKTPQFKKWFGDWEKDPENASKVVDENGEPMVVYHGGHLLRSQTNEGQMFFMTDSLESAQTYSNREGVAKLKGNDYTPPKFATEDLTKIRSLYDLNEILRKEGYEAKQTWRGLFLRYPDGTEEQISNSDEFWSFHVQEIQNTIKHRYTSGDMVESPEFATYGWDSVQELAEAMKKEGYTLDYKPSKTRKGFYDISVTMPDGKNFIFTDSDGDIIGNVDEVSGLGTRQAMYIATKFQKGLRGNFAFYVNMRNPLVVDAHGSSWDNIKFNTNGYTEKSAIGDIKFGSTIDTNGLANYAYEKGYDGVIIKNINDSSTYSGGIGHTTTDYIAFHPNQIKSATDNNGDFSAENPDIRYSRRVPKMRNGESPEAYRDRIDAFNRQQARETDTIKRALVERISELVDDQNLTAINRRRLRSMLRMVELTHANVSEEYYRRAEGVVAEMRTASQQRQIDKLLALKTQDVNGKNMSIAKNVSDDVRKVMEMLRGRIVDLKNSGYEEDMTALRRNIRALTDENKQLEDQIDRGDLDKYQEDEALRTIADNKADIEQCRQDLENLKELKEETERAKLGVRDLDLQGEFDRLEEKLDQAAEGRYVFTAGDRQQYTALEILKLQNEIMKLRNQSNDLKRNRDTTEEALSHLADPNDLNMSDRLLREWDSKNTLIRGIEQEIDNRQKDMIDKLQALISHGKAELKTKIEDELNRRKELLTNMFNDIGGKGGRKLWTMTPKQRKESQYENKVKQFFTAQLGSFEYMAQRIARNTLGEDGWFYKNFVKGNQGVIAARNTYLTGLKEATVTMDDKCQEIYGMPLEKVIKKNGKVEKNTGIYLTREIHGQEIEEPMECSKGQATYWYMVWKMPDGRAKLLNQGFTEQTIAEIREFIGDENAEWADWVQKTYLADLREKYNAKYVDIYNTSMANIANYVPIKIDETDIQRESDLLDDKARKKSLTERAGSLINRTYNTKPIDLTVSAYEVVMNHVNQMEEWNAFARVRKDLDYILGNTAVRNQLNANVSGQWNDLMDASAIATHVYKPAKAEFGDNFMAALTKGIVGGNIAFRYTTALKQMLSVPAYMGYSQDPRFLLALAKNIGVQYVGNIPVLATTMATFGAVGGQHSFNAAAKGKKFTGLTNTVNWCAKNLPGFAERIAKGSAGNYALDDATLGKVLDGYLNKGMVANQMIDAITCAIGIKTMYDYKYARLKADIKKKGLSVEEEKRALEEAHRIALNDADIYYNGTQQSNDAAFLSPMQMSRTMMNKALSVYQNASIGFARKLATNAEDLWRMRHWGDLKARLMEEGMTEAQATKHLGAKAFRSIVGMITYGYVMNALWDLGGKGLLGLWSSGGDDEDKDEDTTLQDAATYISYPMRGMPGMNIVSSLLGGTLKSPLLAYDVADELVRDLEKVYQDNGPVSLEMASLIGNKGLRYAGIDSKAWTNIYLGAERMIREGFLTGFENKDKMIDLMLFLNTPNTNRVDVAKKIYKGEPDEVYATNVLRAMKYLDEADEGWAASLGSLTGMKALTIDKEAQIFKELGITPSEIKNEDVKDVMKKYESLNDLYDAYDNEQDPKRKQTIGKAISKALTQKKYSEMTRAERIAEGKALTTTQTSDKSKQNTIYIGLCKHNDLVQDEALAEALKKLKPTYDEYNDMEDPDEASTFYESHKQIIDKYEELNDSRKEINSLKNDMKESDTQERLNSMNEIRKIRSKALGIR